MKITVKPNWLFAASMIILGLVLVFLKIGNYIQVDWWIVLIPFIWPILIYAAVAMCFLVPYFLYVIATLIEMVVEVFVYYFKKLKNTLKKL